MPAVFPDLPVAVLNSVEDDLQYLTEGDMLPVMKSIQARRLVVAWAQNSKCIEFNTISSHQSTNYLVM